MKITCQASPGNCLSTLQLSGDLLLPFPINVFDQEASVQDIFIPVIEVFLVPSSGLYSRERGYGGI